MISWLTGKVAGIGAVIALMVIAWLGVECALLKHESTELQNTILTYKLAAEKLKSDSVEMKAQHAKESQEKETQILDLAKASLDNYEKGKADATKNFAAISKRTGGLRFAPADRKADTGGGGVPQDAGTSQGTDSACDDKLRDARERFNDLIGGVEKISGALNLCQEQAIRLQQMIEFERGERARINGG